MIILGSFLLTTAVAGNDSLPDFDPYLGLSVPYPESDLEWTQEFKRGRAIQNGRYPVRLEIDDRGEVKDVFYPADSSRFFEPLKKIKKELRFRFLDGRPLDFPMTVPAYLEYSGPSLKSKTVRILCPISSELLTDTVLLAEYFDANGVSPPRIVDLQPIFYWFDRGQKEPQCLTITAQVMLDEQGEMIDLDYPIPGQDRMTHPVQVALMRARFEPARFKGVPFTCDILWTFRAFDNLYYPFSPFRPVETERDPAVTEKYFLTRYFNPGDVSILPLPRRYPAFKIPVPSEYRSTRERIRAKVWISRDGRGSTVSVGNIRRHRSLIAKFSKLASWYPAMNSRGESETFVGFVELELSGAPHFVYIPEWLEE